MESAENRIRILSHLLQSQILIKGQQPLPSDQNYTQVCRVGSVSELPSGDDVTRKFQSIFLKRVAMEHDEIKFLLLTYKRACCQGNQRAPVECERSAEFQSLCEVARESCIDRLLTQVLSVSSESDVTGEESLWMSVMFQGGHPAHDSRHLSALRHLTNCDPNTSPLPNQLLPILVGRLSQSQLGTNTLIRLLRAGGEQVRSVELEEVAVRHQEVFPPVEVLVSIPECTQILAEKLIKEVQDRSSKTGHFYSHSSVFSELLGYGLLMPSINAKFLSDKRYIPLKALPGYPTNIPSMLQNCTALRQQNGEYTHKLCKLAHAILKKMLRAPAKPHKNAPILWLSDVVNAHLLLSAPKFLKGREEELVARAGWRLNLCYVLLLFCEPFFSRTANQKLRGISAGYLASAGCRLDVSQEAGLARGALPPRNSQNADQSDANFITEVFYVTLRALNLLLLAPMQLCMQTTSDLSKAAQSLPAESPERRGLEELSALTFLSWDLSVLNEQFALLLSQFYVTAAIWLRMSIEATQNTDTQKQELSHIPEFLIKDACQWFRFLVTSQPQLFRHLEMAAVIDLFVLLLQRQDLLPGPVAQAKVISFLLSLVQTPMGAVSPGQLIRSWSSVHGELATIMHSNPAVRDQLGPALLCAYSAVDVVEGLDVDKDAFDKFGARQDITQLIRHLWERQDCRDSILRQCDTPVFPTFLGAILDTLLYMLHDSLHRLRNARLIQLSMEEAGWARLTSREQRAKQEFLRSEERVTRGFLSISQGALSLLQLFTETPAVSRLFSTPALSARTASAFIGFFASLCGTRAKEINVKKKENFKFDPKQLLRALSQVLAHILSADSGEFFAALSADQDLELGALKRMAQLMREEGVAWTDTLEELVTRLSADPRTEEAGEEDTSWLSLSQEMELDLDALSDVYKVSLEELRYDTCQLTQCHALRHSVSDSAPAQARLRALLREVPRLQDSLPLHPDSSVFARQDEDRMDLVRALVTGPTGTPYAYGCFQFDCLFPQTYPANPPLVKFCTTGGGTVRMNPNLYADGKVCLSLLGTWHGGDQSEKWDPQVSSLYQVLVSVQGIILIPEPLYNEPGYGSIRGTQEGRERSSQYNSEIALFTLRHAMCDVIRTPPQGFEDVVQVHFSLLRPQILGQCQKWLQDCATSHLKNRMARAVNQLRELLDKL